MLIKNCSRCDKNKPIVNKKHWLCDDCNFTRLHNGVERAEIYKGRIAERVESKIPRLSKPKYKPLKQQTSKEKEIKKELGDLKSSIEQKAIENDKYYCWGCGSSGVGLDKSHILSVKQRKDLELDEANINLFCRTCHMNWESGDISKMIMLNTFENDLQYIQIHSVTQYNRILMMIEKFMVNMFDLIIEGRIDQQLRNRIEYIDKKYNYILH